MTRKKKPKRVKNLDELKAGGDFAIVLNFGLVSRKEISYDKAHDKFHICNLIDGSNQTLTSKQIMDETRTNIGTALKMGALFKE